MKLLEKSRLTWAYCAPEIFRNEYDAKSDLWSVGVILYVLLSATHPFDFDGKQTTE
jgi:serine/threonine protein kinase